MRARIPLFLAAVFLAAGAAKAADGPRESAGMSAPIINPNGGTYPLNSHIRVSIRSQPGTVVVYTLDGRNPAWNHGTITDSHLIFFDLPPGDVVVKAAGMRKGGVRGPVGAAKFVRVGGGHPEKKKNQKIP